MFLTILYLHKFKQNGSASFQDVNLKYFEYA